MNISRTINLSRILGLILFIGGLGLVGLLSLTGSEATETSQKTTEYALLAAFAGIIIFIAGLLLSMLSQIIKPRSIHQEDGAIAATALLRSMIAICISDGDLHEREIQSIVKIYKQLTHSEISPDLVREAAEDMQQNKTNISDELANINHLLYNDLRSQILKAALFILSADGEVDPREEATLEDIRIGLGFSKSKLEAAKEKFLAERGLQSASE